MTFRLLIFIVLSVGLGVGLVYLGMPIFAGMIGTFVMMTILYINELLHRL